MLKDDLVHSTQQVHRHANEYIAVVVSDKNLQSVLNLVETGSQLQSFGEYCPLVIVNAPEVEFAKSLPLNQASNSH